MQVKIVFYKSSSKYYDSCCLQCEHFKSYVNEKNVNTVTLEDDEIREKSACIRSVFEIIKNWSKSEYYIDGEKTTFERINAILDLVYCEIAKEKEVVGDHCFDDNGWGCNYLKEITLRGDSYYFWQKYFWYEFGSFQNGVWTIDKDRIKSTIKEEAKTKHLDFCKFFNINRIYAEIEKLPEQIVVDENDQTCEWQYKYRDAPAGMRETEIIGVIPKESSNSHSIFPININSIFENTQEHTDSDKPAKNVPTVTFDDIGGMANIIQQVREVIELPMIFPSIFEHYHLTPHKGILLYGPPGCGKTLIAKAIANEINAHFISVNGPEILNKFVGESENNLRKIFAEANQINPSIIYFDEFDSISIRRDLDDHLSVPTIVNQLLTLMDGITVNNVCCIASTNRIDMIDEALKRPGRFDYVIEIEKPSLEGCKAIFRIHTDKMPVDVSFNKDRFVEKNLIGLTGAEIAFVASEAAYNSIRRTIDINQIFEGHEIELTDNNILIETDFILAVETLKERKTRENTAKFRYNF